MKQASPTHVRVVVLPHALDLPLPARATDQAAGVDLYAAVEQDWVLMPSERGLVPTGLCLELPRNVEAQVRPRSGLAVKHGITVLNSPGTIDPDYRGEVKVLLINLGAEPFRIRRGDRIAQMVFAEFLDLDIVEAAELTATARGVGGFGSTGNN